MCNTRLYNYFLKRFALYLEWFMTKLYNIIVYRIQSNYHKFKSETFEGDKILTIKIIKLYNKIF